MKTNAARILDALGIRYQLREYQVDESDLSAEAVARKVGLPAEQVFKTLVCRGDRSGALFAVVPGDAQLDFKALGRLSGDRGVEMVSLKEVQPLTGYVRGGVTVLGARKEFPAFADETIESNPLDAVDEVPWWPPERRETTLHRVLVHVIAEIHRHAGHADIVRELVDGAIGMQADASNLPDLDADKWAEYREKLERVARAAGSAQS